jgi:vancomycin resistance protein VanJ
VGADPADGEGPTGPIGQGAAVGSGGDDGMESTADGAPISGTDESSGGATRASAADAPTPSSAAAEGISQSAALAVAAKAPATPPALAISDIIRSAADQASTTWKTAALPSQRRESPSTPFRDISAPAPVPARPAAPALPPAVTPAPAVPASPADESSAASLAAATASATTEAPSLFSAPADSSPSPSPSATLALAPAGSNPATIDAPSVAPDSTAADTASDAAPPATADVAASPSDADDDAHWPGARRQIALLTLGVSLLILAVLLGHRFLPNVMGFGSLIDTFLPWTAVPLVLALPAALLSLKKRAIGVCLLTCAVWAGDFGPTLLRSGGTGPGDIRVLSQNVSVGDSATPDLAGVAQLADQRGADIVVMQGLSNNVQIADQQVPARYRYHIAMYEFVVWSRFPIGATQPVDLAAGPPADQSQTGGAALVQNTSGEFGGLLRFTVDAGQNRQVTVYAVHLPQPSLSHNGFGVARGKALEQLVDDVQAEKSPDLIVVGDLDVAQTDRAMRPLLGSGTGLVSAQAEAGSGFGFTWPAAFPVVRLDDVLTRGLTPVASVVLPAAGPKQAHRPIEADLKF